MLILLQGWDKKVFLKVYRYFYKVEKKSLFKVELFLEELCQSELGQKVAPRNQLSFLRADEFLNNFFTQMHQFK